MTQEKLVDVPSRSTMTAVTPRAPRGSEQDAMSDGEMERLLRFSASNDDVLRLLMTTCSTSTMATLVDLRALPVAQWTSLAKAWTR